MSQDHSHSSQSLHLSQAYIDFFCQLKDRLKNAQIQAALAAKREQIQCYWEIGQGILEKQKAYEWGSKFLDQLAADLHREFPQMRGFSKRNLEYMRRFAQDYPELDFTKQAVSQLPWGHIVKLLQMVNDPDVREWYAQQTLTNGWSRHVMAMQVEGQLYTRQADNSKKLTNYHDHLPKPNSDLAQDILKDPYQFDFLTIQGQAYERDVEQALISHMRDFLLELGQGFAFVGSQVPVAFDDQEYFMDMLFYHLKLRCYVVIEIKASSFKPEHTGQLGFYLSVVDRQMRHPDDHRSIGILLCKTKNQVVAEYALQNINAPIGVSSYTLAEELPQDLESNLPSVETLKAELEEWDEQKKDNEP